ncbi:hypothetical protein, partial [Corynebacterium sp. KPL2699]|uniref:hypothetical protein n=1 Tax=Corynebacterium sp. KPL2699 TaxID=3158311 RepID=UPI0032EC2F39
MKPTKISAALATATITTTLLTPTAQALQPGDKYVALGDSYASTGTITLGRNTQTKKKAHLQLETTSNIVVA